VKSKPGKYKQFKRWQEANQVEITPFKQRNDSSESHLKNLPSQQKEENKMRNRDTLFGLCRASEISKHLGYLNQVAAAQEMS